AVFIFFFSSRRRHTRSDRDWSSDVCSSDLDLRRVGVEDPVVVGLAVRRERLSYGRVELVAIGTQPALHHAEPAVGHDGPSQRRRSEEHTSELQSRSDLVCRLLLEKKNKKTN